MHILNKNISFIEFTDFLSRIDTGSITSHMHFNSKQVLHKIQKYGKCQWEGNVYNKESFLERLQDENGKLNELSLITTAFGPEAILKFDSGHGFTICLKKEEQYAQIYKYLIEAEVKNNPTY